MAMTEIGTTIIIMILFPMTASLREGGTLLVVAMVVTTITITCLEDHHAGGMVSKPIMMTTMITITTTIILIIGASLLGIDVVPVRAHCLSTMISQGPATAIGGIHPRTRGMPSNVDMMMIIIMAILLIIVTSLVVSTETRVLIYMSTKSSMLRESLGRPLELAHGEMMGITMMMEILSIAMTIIVTMIAGGDVLRISTVIILDADGTMMTTMIVRKMDLLRASMSASLTGIVAGISLQIIQTQGAS
jgi:hypothetical protein